MPEELFAEGGDGADLPFTPEQLVQEGVPSGAGPTDDEARAARDAGPPTAVECLAQELQEVERESSRSPPHRGEDVGAG